RRHRPRRVRRALLRHPPRARAGRASRPAPHPRVRPGRLRADAPLLPARPRGEGTRPRLLGDLAAGRPTPGHREPQAHRPPPLLRAAGDLARHWLRRCVPPREAPRGPHRGLTGALGRPTIPIPLGCCVGGTTTINSGTCYRAPDYVLDEWVGRYGVRGVDEPALRPYFERVEAELGVRPVPDAIYGRNSQL